MNWMKLRWLYFAISGLIIIPGIYSLVRYGLNLSIEFTGGTQLTLNSVSSPNGDILNAFSKYEPVIESSTNSQVKLKLNTIDQDTAKNLTTSLKTTNPNITLADFETVGSVVGQETIRKTIYAILISATLLTLFITFAFKQLKYGICAVLGMFHDTAVLLGSFSLLGHFYNVQVDLLFVTAMLTILSFSVHDTIVVYDRIRELSHKESHRDYTDLANQAVSETMIRSLNNSLTIIFMLLAMYLMGGETTKYFALALLIGTVSGTYSSTFTSVPLLVVWDNLSKKLHSRK